MWLTIKLLYLSNIHNLEVDFSCLGYATDVCFCVSPSYYLKLFFCLGEEGDVGVKLFSCKSMWVMEL